MTTINPEQGILLAVFFLLFAYCGFVKHPGRGLPPAYFVVWGVLAILANSIALMAMNVAGLGDYAILDLLRLKQVSIESSFVILGYCLLVRAAANYVRILMTPSALRSRRSVL